MYKRISSRMLSNISIAAHLICISWYLINKSDCAPIGGWTDLWDPLGLTNFWVCSAEFPFSWALTDQVISLYLQTTRLYEWAQIWCNAPWWDSPGPVQLCSGYADRKKHKQIKLKLGWRIIKSPRFSGATLCFFARLLALTHSLPV